MKKVYSEKDKILATNRDMFFDSPEQHLQHHPQLSQVKTWLNLVKKTILQSKQQALDIATKGMKGVFHYFQKKESIQTSKKKKKIRNKKGIPRHHQTYIYFTPDNSLGTTMIPEHHAHTLSPKQIQPQIPWQHRYRQTFLTAYT